ncbi:hypothetical protein OG885_08955 [Streptomyces sp. NBC_00028]|uniref:hypothetical protein n=1 Tax=Streptomyces sp. NBC_00028 TaxID=2975624 RepID=UPI00324F4AB4
MTDYAATAQAERHRSRADGDAAARPVYEMRSLHTDAERMEAVALVEDRLGWLARHSLPVPARTDIPELFCNDTQAVGLFEDGVLLACMILALDVGTGRGNSVGTGPGLLLQHVYTLPEHPDDMARLITLWSSDCAARLGRPHVGVETYTSSEPDTGPTCRLLNRLQDMGWTVTGTAVRLGEQVIRLALRAEARPALRALIGCAVPPPAPASTDSNEDVS